MTTSLRRLYHEQNSPNQVCIGLQFRAITLGMNSLKSLLLFALGVLFGSVTIGGLWWVASGKSDDAELFANKERCATYTQKRQAEAEEKSNLLGTSISVQGFYSPTANTCMTETQETAIQHYMQRILVDELTGRREAFAFEMTGKDWMTMSDEEKQHQIEQIQLYGERLEYFRGGK